MDKNLSEIYTEWRSKMFAWGSADCCAFAFFCMQKIHGDAIKFEYPKYDTPREAYRILRRLGGYTGVLEKAGLSKQKGLYHRRGDVVILMPKDADQLLGVSFGYDVLCRSHGGLVPAPRDWIGDVWRMS